MLEYNARFGDPEAQVVLPRMKNDIIDVMEACVDGKLDAIDLQFEDNAAVCVVLASTVIRWLMKKDLKSPDLRSLREKRITSVSMPEQNSMRQEKLWPTADVFLESQRQEPI